MLFATCEVYVFNRVLMYLSIKFRLFSILFVPVNLKFSKILMMRCGWNWSRVVVEVPLPLPFWCSGSSSWILACAVSLRGKVTEIFIFLDNFSNQKITCHLTFCGRSLPDAMCSQQKWARVSVILRCCRITFSSFDQWLNVETHHHFRFLISRFRQYHWLQEGGPSRLVERRNEVVVHLLVAQIAPLWLKIDYNSCVFFKLWMPLKSKVYGCL